MESKHHSQTVNIEVHGHHDRSKQITEVLQTNTAGQASIRSSYREEPRIHHHPKNPMLLEENERKEFVRYAST